MQQRSKIKTIPDSVKRRNQKFTPLVVKESAEYMKIWAMNTKEKTHVIDEHTANRTKRMGDARLLSCSVKFPSM